mgnify:CR=1 FL=1
MAAAKGVVTNYRASARAAKLEKELEDRITKRVLEKISIEVLNEAGPAMKELKQQLDSLFPIG